ncbi:MAG TPA: hypothetical protein VGH14_17020 [Solirubrobacterales bacterium]
MNRVFRVTRHTRGLRLIAIGAVMLPVLSAAAVAMAGAPHIPTPSQAKSTLEMEGALAQEFGRTFIKSSHQVDCNQRISRTIVKCAVDFRYHAIVWSGHGRIWRGICNGSNGITKNGHHVCWFANWRLHRFDERCHTEQHHSVAYCTEPVIHH